MSVVPQLPAERDTRTLSPSWVFPKPPITAQEALRVPTVCSSVVTGFFSVCLSWDLCSAFWGVRGGGRCVSWGLGDRGPARGPIAPQTPDLTALPAGAPTSWPPPASSRSAPPSVSFVLCDLQEQASPGRCRCGLGLFSCVHYVGHISEKKRQTRVYSAKGGLEGPGGIREGHGAGPACTGRDPRPGRLAAAGCLHRGPQGISSTFKTEISFFKLIKLNFCLLVQKVPVRKGNSRL